MLSLRQAAQFGWIVALTSLLITNGCAVGLVAAAFGIKGLADKSENDAPPVVSFIATPSPMESPDKIEVKFKVTNEDGGNLEAMVEFFDVQSGADVGPLPGSTLLTDITNAEEITFVWDAEQGLAGDSSSQVKTVVTPLEDGKKGKQESSTFFRAGNICPVIRKMLLSNQGFRVDVSLDLTDKEKDRVRLSKIQIMSSEVPLGLADRQDFATSPDGERASFSLNFAELDDPRFSPELRSLGRQGFSGDVAVRVEVQDYPEDVGCNAAQANAHTAMAETFFFDNNNPTSLRILPFEPEDLESGIVPIRYTILDADKVPVNVRMTVEIGGTTIFANEFPVFPSMGTVSLCPIEAIEEDNCIPPLFFGGTNQPYHTFLWDALSQPFPGDRVIVSVMAEGEERSQATQVLSRFRLTPFSPVKEIIAGDGFSPVKAGDFDGDGILDLAVANRSSNFLGYVRGQAGGLSESPIRSIDVGNQLRALATLDFNHDGIIDLVAASGASRLITFLPGNGETGLTTDGKAEITVDASPSLLLTGDFDGDGSLDLVVGNSDANKLFYFRGLSKDQMTQVPIPQRPFSLTAGDFDGDGSSDLVVANDATKIVSYLPGGVAWLTKPDPRNIEVSGIPRRFATGDFDNDGSLDLVVGNAASSKFSYFRGTSNGGLPGRPEDIDVLGSQQIALATGDFDGDGVLDLAVANEGTSRVSYFRGDEGGLSKIQRLDLEVQGEPMALSTGDFDGDGAPDLIVATQGINGLTYFYGGADGLSPRRRRDIALEKSSGSLLNGDFEGDSALDLVVVNGAPGGLSYFRGDRLGFSEERRKITKVGDLPSALVKGDFDGDRALDLAVANLGPVSDENPSGTVSYLRGTGGFSESARLQVGVSPLALTGGDFDGDQVQDIVVVNSGPFSEDGPAGSVSYFRGKKRDGLSQDRREDIEVGVFPFALVPGDFDGDGTSDVAVLNSGPISEENPNGSVTYIRGKKTEGLSQGRIEELEVGMSPTALTTGDFDADGVADLIVATGGPVSEDNPAGFVTYFRGLKESGISQSSRQDIVVGLFPFALATGDFNGDGALDLAVANSVGPSEEMPEGTVTFLPGKESVGLVEEGKLDVTVGLFPRSFATGDLDGDGIMDLVVANGDSSTVSYVRWKREGEVVKVEKSDLAVGENPVALTTGDFDGDGALDLVVVNQGSRTLTYFGGGTGGPAGQVNLALPTGEEPGSVVTGDFNGDATLDIALVNASSNTVIYFLSRYLVPHLNCQASAFAGEPCSFSDPRRPARYRLELPTRGIPVTGFPTNVFELPQIGSFKTAITDAVTLPPNARNLDGEVLGAVFLVLRVRDRDLNLLEGLEGSSRIKVFLKDPQTGVAMDAGATASIVNFTDGALGGTGIRFRITKFGSYVVAIDSAK